MTLSRRTLLKLATGGFASAALGLTACAEALPPVRGTRHFPSPEEPLTPTSEWYFVALREAYESDMRGWRLRVGGLTRKSARLSLDELRRRYEVVEAPITLACVGDTPNGRLHSSALFQGVRFMDLVEDLGLSSRASGVLLGAVDGYVVFRALEQVLRPDTLLAFAMGTSPNDLVALPLDHGFPLRILTPGRYGYVQPKWLSSITFVDDSDHVGVLSRSLGYSHGEMQLASAFTYPWADGVTLPPGARRLYGYAYGDGRRIARVELSVDGGPWIETQLAYNGPEDELPPGVWVIWVLDWEARPGEHSLRLRATYEDGESQLEGRDFPYSGGSLVTRVIRVAEPEGEGFVEGEL